MRPHPPRFLLLAVGLASSALAGCGSMLPPRPLTAAQSSLVDRAGNLGVVAVSGDVCLAGAGCASRGERGDLHAMLERTGLFRAVVDAGSDDPAPDYLATIQGRCSYRRGGWIPLLPLLTFGVVPQFSPMNLGYAFTLRNLATGKETRIPCEIRVMVGVGWLPALMNVLPGWSLDDPEKTRNFGRRLAYAITSRTAPAHP